MDLAKMDKEVLESYVEMRRSITKRVDRVVAVTALLMLLKQCGDDLIKVSPHALADLADQIDSDVCAIQEVLDGFVFVTEAEVGLSKE